MLHYNAPNASSLSSFPPSSEPTIPSLRRAVYFLSDLFWNGELCDSCRSLLSQRGKSFLLQTQRSLPGVIPPSGSWHLQAQALWNHCTAPEPALHPPTSRLLPIAASAVSMLSKLGSESAKSCFKFWHACRVTSTALARCEEV